MQSAVLTSFAFQLFLHLGDAYNNMMLPDLSSMQNMGGLQLPQIPQLGQLPQLGVPGLQNFMPQLQSNAVDDERIPCSCGIFLNGQFRKGSTDPPVGNAALLQEMNEPFQCNAVGEKQCQTRCLETIMRYLPKSPVMVCGSIDRDCYRERAYLFIKNCKDKWINTNLSAGREFCCKDGMPYNCNEVNSIVT